METVMHARSVIIAAAALALATNATAQSAKTPRQSNPAPTHPAPVVLASADHIASAPATDAAPAQPKPHRAARVTTCRCGGDPQPAPQDDQQ
jgi:hypothetical protein